MARKENDRRPDQDPAVIRCEAIGFAEGARKALSDVGFELLRGEFACLVGPAGSGKTTLLRVLHGQLRPSAGRLWVDGMEVRGRRARDVRRVRRRISIVSNEYGLLERLSALENVAYPLRLRDLSLPAGEAERRATGALERLGLQDSADAHPGQLTEQQRRRLAIARALAGAPGALLVDAPSDGLDGAGARELMSLLRGIAGEGTSLLVATSDAGLATGPGCRYLELAGGWLVDDRREPAPPAAKPVAGGSGPIHALPDPT